MRQSSTFCLFVYLVQCARALRVENDGTLPVRGFFFENRFAFVPLGARLPTKPRSSTFSMSFQRRLIHCFRIESVVLRRPNTAMERIQRAVPLRPGMRVCYATRMMALTTEGRMLPRFAELLLLSKSTRRA